MTTAGGPPAPPAPDPAGEPAPPPAPPLTPVGWLLQNGPWLLILLLGAAWLYKETGLDGLVRGAEVILGLGFVIFIHELGHFLTAKWCDVHVQTFSIGFGPALPGCIFQRGETTYKIGILPLGGYVSMVGEGPEADEDEDYPRSFKNKTVGQRMLIISAGVVMNVLFGCLAFVVVYRYHGVERPPAVIWSTEPGSRAWEAGVSPGWAIAEIDGKKKVWFDDMRIAVALSWAHQAIHFKFETPDGKEVSKTLEPRSDQNDVVPVIGVTQLLRLQLYPREVAKSRALPVGYESAAAAAREIDLGPGDVVVAATHPDTEKVTDIPLPGSPEAWAVLCRRLMKLRDKEVVLRVRRAGAKEGQEETVKVPARGFDWGDTIVGTTDPDHPDQPFLVKELPLIDPLHLGQPVPSPFAYRRRMHLLAGKPAVLQVRRAGEGDSSRAVSILVPPAFHYTLGMRMKMGKVAGVRQESPAQEAGLMAGDVITRVSVAYAQGKPRELTEKELDPVRLPYELDRIIHGHRPGDDKPDPKKWRVTLTVQRTANHNAQQPQTLAPMEWDDTWQSGSERPVGMAAPMAIPQLGIAYWVESTVVAVKKGSPADQAGIQPNDVLRQIRFLEPGKKPGDEPRRGRWYDMFSLRGKEGKEKNYDEWAHFFWGLQHSDLHEVEVRVKRGEKDDDTPLGPMKAEADRTWPMADRGLLLRVDTRLQKASTLLEGLNFGLDRTVGFIKQIYLNLSSLVSGRISTKSLGGPIEIASQAFSVAGEDLWVFTLFLGIISINLAVVNFLPIPVLDGGHMVFLIYEKLRGKPPPEAVRNVATYIGLATILLLMGFVFYLDIKRHGWFSNWF